MFKGLFATGVSTDDNFTILRICTRLQLSLRFPPPMEGVAQECPTLEPSWELQRIRIFVHFVHRLFIETIRSFHFVLVP